VVCTNLYCKKLKVKNEGKKFIENTYSLIENSSINKKELEELVSSQKFSDLINNTPILPVEKKSLKKNYTITLRRD
jgi:Ring finger domain